MITEQTYIDLELDVDNYTPEQLAEIDLEIEIMISPGDLMRKLFRKLREWAYPS